MDPNWLIWQLADSAFPTGGFAHSAGLEAAVQWGEVTSANDLTAFTRSALTQIARSTIPIVCTACSDPIQYESLDRLTHALLTNHVANRASRAQGQAMLTAADRIFPSPDLAAMRQSVRTQRLHGHFAPVFGRIMGILNTTRDLAGQLFLFISLRGIISAAVRLGAVGPMEGQRIQHELGSEATTIAARCSALTLDDITQTAPLVDLLQGTHDRLYSRLFQS
jgi:urease accessory protein